MGDESKTENTRNDSRYSPKTNDLVPLYHTESFPEAPTRRSLIIFAGSAVFLLLSEPGFQEMKPVKGLFCQLAVHGNQVSQ